MHETVNAKLINVFWKVWHKVGVGVVAMQMGSDIWVKSTYDIAGEAERGASWDSSGVSTFWKQTRGLEGKSPKQVGFGTLDTLFWQLKD